VSVEGTAQRYGVLNESGRSPFDGTQLGVAAKLNLPLGNRFEAFGRGGLQRTWLSTNTNQPSYTGNGWLVGAGIEYRLDLGVAGGSIFIDYTYADTTFTKQNAAMAQLDGSAGMWTLGLTLSI
jgi:hypothetical protein